MTVSFLPATLVGIFLRLFMLAVQIAAQQAYLTANRGTQAGIAGNRPTVVKRYAPTLPPVLGVRQELEQVLLNILVNAWQATAGGGTLTMVTERRDAQAVIAIADTGCGIPEAHMSRLFEPFFTTKPMEQGTGLGLAVDWVLPLEKDRPTLVDLTTDSEAPTGDVH